QGHLNYYPSKPKSYSNQNRLPSGKQNSTQVLGLLYSFVTVGRRSPSSGGPWVVYAVIAIQCFVVYFMMWASVVGLILPLPVPAMCLFMWMAAHAQTFFNTADVVTGVHNFGDYGGTIIGIMKLRRLR
ncbi:hypothetical protein LINPERPRIM_LOCUS11325, partial [Linum perenne]